MTIQVTHRSFVQGLAASGAALNLKYSLAETATDAGEYRAFEDLYRNINSTPGVFKVPFDELAAKGIIRVENLDSTLWEHKYSPYHHEVIESVRDKKPCETFTGRQQLYIDHEWFIIKPTTMAGDYGHLGYQPLAFAPNETCKDFTCDFEKADPNTGQQASASKGRQVT